MSNVIKRRQANRTTWPRILERRFVAKAINEPEYNGYVTLLCMDKVSEPLWIEQKEQQFCIVDNGYSWLQQFPTGTRYTVTSSFDEHGRIVQWYVDICLEHGIDKMGIPWWDDLFLDVIILPNGDCQIVDGDELDAALQSGAIDEAQHRLAWAEATKVTRLIEQNNFPLLALSLHQRAALLTTLGSDEGKLG